MKKYFENPEVSSVELTNDDVIMASVEIAGTNANITAWKDSNAVAADFAMWQGFKNN